MRQPRRQPKCLREAREELTAEGEDGESAIEFVKQKTKSAASKVVERTRAEAERQGLGDMGKSGCLRPWRSGARSGGQGGKAHLTGHTRLLRQEC